MSDPSRLRRLAALVLLLAAAALAGACGGSGDVEVSQDGGGVDVVVEEDGASVAVDQGDDVRIPDSWPASVPKPDAQATLASDAMVDGQQAWTVVFGGAGKADYDAYVSALEAAGGENLQTFEQDGLLGCMFRFDDLIVSAQFAEESGLSVVIGNAAS